MLKTTKKFYSVVAKIMLMLILVCTVGLSCKFDANAAGETLLNTYGNKYGNSGTCINLYQLKDANTLSILKRDYNSITLENEMKPDALLGNSARLISVSQAKNQGYYIPDNYKEQYVPQINFSTIDEVMKICYQNGLKMRAHTLVWHSQTPGWFFRNGYNGGSSFVNSSTMDARLEMYVKTVMNHVYSSQYGSVVYAWDVANEVLHAQNSGWEAVYGNNRTNASYVKKAFNYAYDTLSYYKLTGSVKLFYNDYNTYDEVEQVKTLVNYINQGRKVCDGVGMQSHITTRYTSVDKYMNALNSFLNAGFEVQITELDIVANNDNDFNNYAYQLFKRINAAKKSGGKITSITWWGLSDQTTWIRNAKPLLFSTPGNPKPVYNKVIQAYTETFGQGSTGGQTGGGQTGTTTNPNQTAHIDDGWYYIKNTLSQKYLTVDADNADGWKNVVIKSGTGVDAQKWYVTNTSDGYITLTNKLGNVMLDVANAETDDGTNVGIYSAYGGNAQQFVVKATGTNGVYTIGTKCTNATKYLDVYEKKTTDGTNVCQWAYNGGTNQQWVFEKVDNSKAPQTETPAEKETGSKEETPVAEDPQPQPQPAGLSVAYSINNWGSGYQVSFKVSNAGSTVNTWTVKVKKSDVTITSSWNVNIDEQGDYYVITPVEWNSTIATGQSVEFGIQGTGSIGETITCSVN